jgi:hypothetical protein
LRIHAIGNDHHGEPDSGSRRAPQDVHEVGCPQIIFWEEIFPEKIRARIEDQEDAPDRQEDREKGHATAVDLVASGYASGCNAAG